MARGALHSGVVRAYVALRDANPDEPRALENGREIALHALSSALSTSAVSKAAAAEYLGVSAQTVDSWVSKGLLPVVEAEGFKRERVPVLGLVALASEIQQLRSEGRQRGLLVEALSRIESCDPEAHDLLESLRRRAAEPFNRDQYVSATPPADWDPED